MRHRKHVSLLQVAGKTHQICVDSEMKDLTESELNQIGYAVGSSKSGNVSISGGLSKAGGVSISGVDSNSGGLSKAGGVSISGVDSNSGGLSKAGGVPISGVDSNSGGFSYSSGVSNSHPDNMSRLQLFHEASGKSDFAYSPPSSPPRNPSPPSSPPRNPIKKGRWNESSSEEEEDEEELKARLEKRRLHTQHSESLDPTQDSRFNDKIFKQKEDSPDNNDDSSDSKGDQSENNYGEKLFSYSVCCMTSALPVCCMTSAVPVCVAQPSDKVFHSISYPDQFKSVFTL